MTEHMMLDELDDEMIGFGSNVANSNVEKVDSILIKKILSEMKCEFNRTNNNPRESSTKEDSETETCLNSTQVDDKEISSGSPEEGEDENADKTETVSDNVTNSLNDTKNDGELEDETSEELPISEGNVVLTHKDNFGDEDTVESYQTSEGIDVAPESRVKPTSDTNQTSETEKEDCSEEFVPEKIVDDAVNFTESSSPISAETEEVPETKRSRRGSRVLQPSDCEVNLKRSSRRMSKENSRESVLQSAIALKEKSFSSLQNDDKPQRRSSRLVDNERSLTTRLRNRAARYAGESTESFNNVEDSLKTVLKPANIDKTRYSTEDDTEGESKYGLLRSDSKLPDEDEDQKLRDSGSSESFTTEVSPKPKPKKRRKPGPVPGFKRKKLVQAAESRTEDCNNFSSSQEKFEENQCECRVMTSLFVRCKDQELQFCTGVDSIEKKAVGCDNLADTTFPLVRPLPRVPFQSLCSVHIDRLLRHNCCPLCGVFCTRGMFMHCKLGHFYHKDCDLFYDNYTVCPHCGRTDTKEVTLMLAKTNNPFFLPIQKLFDKGVSARITVAPLSRLKISETDESDLSATPNIILPSGVELSMAGAPPLERDLLKKCLSVFTSKNADLNCRFTNRNMFQAAKTGDIEKLIQILWSGLSPNVVMKDGTPLHAACRNNHLATIHLLVQAGACIDALDRDQYTPLMLACQQGHAHVVRYLIGAGAERAFKGAGGMTALHVAAKEGHLECCFFLLSNTSSPTGVVDALDEGNWTALVWAAENKQVEVVRFLIRKKANIHLRDTERNIAIHWAALAGSFDILEDLLNEGSDMNATNVYGDTPLHIAAREGSTECVMLLLSRGAIPDMVNKAAMVPRDCCRVPNPFIYDLISVSMKFTLVTANIPVFPRLLTNDITRGKEINPIQCVNEIDDDGIPTDFVYVTENCFTTNVQVDNRITSLIPCQCEDTCTASDCACTLNSKGCWYDSVGKLIPDFNYEDPPLVFECNPACRCNMLTCVNRVVQKGIRVHLQMCKTQSKNWGVITLKDIPKGTYVCEYIGEIISDSEADTRQDDSYLFDLDNKEKESYCIDARWYGNITRFINHSCKPNLFPVRVFINHHDLRFPRIAFFAARDIPSHEELGFDYGEKFWMVKYKTFTCTCGADNCHYSDKTIHQTVQKYNESLKLEEQPESIT